MHIPEKPDGFCYKPVLYRPLFFKFEKMGPLGILAFLFSLHDSMVRYPQVHNYHVYRVAEIIIGRWSPGQGHYFLEFGDAASDPRGQRTGAGQWHSVQPHLE